MVMVVATHEDVHHVHVQTIAFEQVLTIAFYSFHPAS
jgi:hypothetical protein